MKFVTFSKNIFIPVTNVCRNRCAYCGFGKSPGEKGAILLSPSQVEDFLRRGNGASEALFTIGERADSFPWILSKLEKLGYSSIVDYMVDLCKISITYGLLPHLNLGVLSPGELKKLKPWVASMGLMLESIERLEAHKLSPGKEPMARLEMMKSAGLLRIPFTTGILIGIGENFSSRVKSILAIKRLHDRYNHIQEVIIQPFLPKPGTPMGGWKGPGVEELKRTVYMARKILPQEISVQIPPNLAPLELLLYGASDLGGISTETPDYISPEARWPSLKDIERRIHPLCLRERLPIYPRYVKMRWYSSNLRELIERYSDGDGYRNRNI